MVTYRRTESVVDGFRAYSLVRSVGMYYPDFEHWFVNRGLPEACTGGGSLILAEDGDDVVGVVMGKRSETETKLRLLRVAPSHQNRGVGPHLMDHALRELGEDAPLCTVCEEMLGLYARMFVNMYDWRLDRVERGMYRPDRLEYLFNSRGVVRGADLKRSIVRR